MTITQHLNGHNNGHDNTHQQHNNQPTPKHSHVEMRWQNNSNRGRDATRLTAGMFLLLFTLCFLGPFNMSKMGWQ